MAVVIGLCGLTGVGKTTVRNYLVEKTAAEGIYLGKVVLEEVRRRQMPETRESERIVRVDLREHNRAEMVVRCLDEIVRITQAGRPAVIDAVLLPEELACLRSALPEARMCLIKVHADLEKRVARLSARINRPLSSTEISQRDSLELENFRTGEVLTSATHSLDNNGSESDLQNLINQFWQSLNFIS